jgi:hypothetical protein
VETIAIRQVLAVRAGGRRWTSAAVGKSARAVRQESRRQQPTVERVHYGDHVVAAVEQRRADARFLGVEEGPVHREWAWPELVALAAAGLLLVVGLLTA